MIEKDCSNCDNRKIDVDSGVNSCKITNRVIYKAYWERNCKYHSENFVTKLKRMYQVYGN